MQSPSNPTDPYGAAAKNTRIGGIVFDLGTSLRQASKRWIIGPIRIR
jgi:hypothetical protein